MLNYLVTLFNAYLHRQISPRPAIFTFLIILLLTLAIGATLMICQWLLTTILADNDLQSLKNNYPAFSN